MRLLCRIPLNKRLCLFFSPTTHGSGSHLSRPSAGFFSKLPIIVIMTLKKAKTQINAI